MFEILNQGVFRGIYRDFRKGQGLFDNIHGSPK